MLYEVIRWISISLCWAAIALNIIAMIANCRSIRKLSDVRKQYIEMIIKMNEEKENELFDKDCK